MTALELRESVRREYMAQIRRNRLRLRREFFLTWASFRHNWPMALYDFAKDFGAGVLLGVCLGLSTLVYVLSRVVV